jgi:hypothetical protein
MREVESRLTRGYLVLGLENGMEGRHMKLLTPRAAWMTIAMGVLVAGHDAEANGFINGYPRLEANVEGPTGSQEICALGCGFTPGGLVEISVSGSFSGAVTGQLFGNASNSGPLIGCFGGCIPNVGCGYDADVGAVDVTTSTPSNSVQLPLDCIQ